MFSLAKSIDRGHSYSDRNENEKRAAVLFLSGREALYCARPR